MFCPTSMISHQSLSDRTAGCCQIEAQQPITERDIDNAAPQAVPSEKAPRCCTSIRNPCSKI